MSDFYNIKVADTIKETKDCTSITFDIPEGLREAFAYKQGQYLTLKVLINGEDVRRSYSLCSSPVENKWQVAVKRIDEGLFSNFANNDLLVGDTLEVMPPSGNFFIEVDPSKPKNYIVFESIEPI